MRPAGLSIKVTDPLTRIVPKVIHQEGKVKRKITLNSRMVPRISQYGLTIFHNAFIKIIYQYVKSGS